MNAIYENSSESVQFGHNLTRPLLWYGRSIAQVFSKPYPEELQYQAIEFIVRLVTFIALAILLPITVIAVPTALTGWIIQRCTSTNHEEPKIPIPESSNSGSAAENPSALMSVGEVTKSSPSNSVHPLQSFGSSAAEHVDDLLSPPTPPEIFQPAIITQLGPERVESAQRNSSSSSSSFVPCTSETVKSAQDKVLEISALYNGLKELGGRDAQELFTAIAEFRLLYDKHRNPDSGALDEMLKTFTSFDEIIRNTEGMHLAQQYWIDFYQVLADAQGVIEQPKDGNCWLHTSIQGLKHINHPNLGDDTYLTLRPKIVDWMRHHCEFDATLKRFISEAIVSHKEVESRRLQEEETSLKGAIRLGLIPADQLTQGKENLKNYSRLKRELVQFDTDDYLNHMENVGSHGTHAELYVISKIFKVNVAIWREIPARENEPSRLTNEYDEQIEHPAAIHTINAVLTQQGNHFNYRLPQPENEL